MNNVKKYPPELNAASEITLKYSYGDFIPVSDLLRMLDMEQDSDPDVLITAREWKERDFKLLRLTDALKSELLENHRILLLRERGQDGYRIVQPAEQTRIAMVDLQKALRQVTKKAMKRLLYVDQSRLSVEEQRENSEAVAKLALIDKSTKKSLGFSHKKQKKVCNEK